MDVTCNVNSFNRSKLIVTLIGLILQTFLAGGGCNLASSTTINRKKVFLMHFWAKNIHSTAENLQNGVSYHYYFYSGDNLVLWQFLQRGPTFGNLINVLKSYQSQTFILELEIIIFVNRAFKRFANPDLMSKPDGAHVLSDLEINSVIVNWFKPVQIVHQRF